MRFAMRVECMFKCLHLSFFLFVATKGVRSDERLDNNSSRILIEEAGCPYNIKTQFLSKNVCLMPNYQLNEPPKNEDGKTNVDVNLKTVFQEQRKSL